MRKVKVASSSIVVLVVAALVVATASGGRGADGSVSASGARSQMVEPQAPTTLLAAARGMAQATAGDPALAARSLRMLRADVGGGASVYAFERRPGSTCLIVWKRTSTCPTGQSDPVVFMVSGGYPAWATPSSLAVPSVLVGFAHPEVSAITFDDGSGTVRPVALENRAFLVELGSDASNSVLGTLTVVHASGKVETVRIPLR